MDEQKAKDTLIALAVCTDAGLSCVDHCPFYKEEASGREQQKLCARAIAHENIIEAVGTLTGNGVTHGYN